MTQKITLYGKTQLHLSQPKNYSRELDAELQQASGILKLTYFYLCTEVIFKIMYE